MLRTFLPLLAAVLAAGCAVSAENPTPGQQVAQSAEVASDAGGTTTLSYLIALPPAAQAKPADGWPLVFFLHGAGERGDNLAVLKKHGPPKLIGSNKALDQAIVVSPQCPKGRVWDLVALKDLIDKVCASQPVDKNRIYLTGLSMGGFGTWGLLAKHPDLAAAAVPICGGGDPTKVSAYKTVPIWVFHGAKDPAVPLAKSEAMVDALRKAGATPEPKFTIYPDEAHESWTPAYNDPALWTWLFAQKKPKA